MTTGERAEQSGFCSNLTIFGYLHCARRRQVRFPLYLLLSLLIELARQSAQCHYDVTSICSQAYCTACGSDAFADQSQRTHNIADQSQRRASPTCSIKRSKVALSIQYQYTIKASAAQVKTSVSAASSAVVPTSSPLPSAWHGMVDLARFAELSLSISLNAKLQVCLTRPPLIIVSLFSSYGNKCLEFRFAL